MQRCLALASALRARGLGRAVTAAARGRWRERLNTDSAHYGGSNLGTPLGQADSQPVACNGRADSIVIDLPPLASVFFECSA